MEVIGLIFISIILLSIFFIIDRKFGKKREEFSDSNKNNGQLTNSEVIYNQSDTSYDEDSYINRILCKECGNKIEINSRFCSFCGAQQEITHESSKIYSSSEKANLQGNVGEEDGKKEAEGFVKNTKSSTIEMNI